MCVAIAIVAGIGVAGTVGAAKISSNASKNAARTQGEAGDRAIAFQREQYAQSRADFDPYLQAGRTALAGMQDVRPAMSFDPNRQLGSYAGTPTPAGQSGPGPAGKMAPPAQGAPVGADLSPMFQPKGQAAMTGAVADRFARGADAAGPSAAMAQARAAGGGAGEFWMMQAPDGTTERLPAAEAQKFLQHGARRVG